jgi:competence protein ComEA
MDAWLEKYRGYLALTLVYLVIFGAVELWRQPRPAPIEVLDPSPRPTWTAALLVVHVTGAVMRPEVYTLAENSRLKDALLAAGGPSAVADLSAVNLAVPLHDGQRVHIPAQGEPPPTAVSLGQRTGALVNVNTASLAELETLPGIGPALGQRIIEDREANGPYESVDQLTRVRGIGPTVLEKLRPLVCVH